MDGGYWEEMVSEQVSQDKSGVDENMVGIDGKYTNN